MKSLLKFLKKIMTGYDIETLVAIKNSFQGQNFQWIKTKDRAKLAKVVRVVDVVPGNRGGFFAELSDGSRIPTDLLTSDLMMLMDDQQPLSMSEVLSINYVPSLNESEEPIRVADVIPAEFREEIASQPIARPIPQTKKPNVPSAEPTSDPGDLFGMFSLEETALSLSISLKLPAKNLLKMMYSNSQNKEEFLDKLATYINSNVTTGSIKESMRRSLDPDKKKR